MLRLHPAPVADVDPYDAYRPADPRAAMVRINMVTSVDGHVVGGDGVSGTIGGDGDQMVFTALRHLADGILAGAGTVRAEDYGGMKVREALRARREADGRSGPARIVVVTGSVDLDPAARLFTDTEVPPVVVTTTDADPGRVAAVEDAGAEVVRAGTGTVDLVAALRLLQGPLGMPHLLCEGGPRLNGALLAAGLVDELCLTVGPALLGGEDERRIVTGLEDGLDLRLARVLSHDDELMLTYDVRR